MSENKDLLEKLRAVIDPEIGISIVDLEMVRELIVEDGTAYVKLALTVSGCPLAGSIENDVKKVLMEQQGISNVVVEMGSMTPEELKAVGAKIQKMRSEGNSSCWFTKPKCGISETSPQRNPEDHNGDVGQGRSRQIVRYFCDRG